MKQMARATARWWDSAKGLTLLYLLSTRPRWSGYHRTSISQQGFACHAFPGSADVPVGSHFAARLRVLRRVALSGPREGRRFAARLRVLLSVAWRPRTRSEVRCGWSCGDVAEDVEPVDGGRWLVARPSWSGRQQVKQGRLFRTTQPPRCCASSLAHQQGKRVANLCL